MSDIYGGETICNLNIKKSFLQIKMQWVITLIQNEGAFEINFKYMEIKF